MADTQSSIYGPAFQEMRLKALERDGYRCVACNHDGSAYRLEVHHRTYERGAHPALSDLYTFCCRCHDLWTHVMRSDRYALRETQVVETVTNIAPRPVFGREDNVDVVEVRHTMSAKVQLPSKTEVSIPELQSDRRVKPF